MLERNDWIESGGLVLDNGTFEWFADKIATTYAQEKNRNGISLPNIVAYVTRNKETGDYTRVLVDENIGQDIYSSDDLEDICYKIDQLKIIKAFEEKNERNK